MRQQIPGYFLFAFVAALFWPAPAGQIAAQIRVRIARPRVETKRKSESGVAKLGVYLSK